MMLHSPSNPTLIEKKKPIPLHPPACYRIDEKSFLSSKKFDIYCDIHILSDVKILLTLY